MEKNTLRDAEKFEVVALLQAKDGAMFKLTAEEAAREATAKIGRPVTAKNMQSIAKALNQSFRRAAAPSHDSLTALTGRVDSLEMQVKELLIVVETLRLTAKTSRQI